MLLPAFFLNKLVVCYKYLLFRMSLQQFCMKLLHAYFHCQILLQAINKSLGCIKSIFCPDAPLKYWIKMEKKNSFKPLTGSGIMQKAGFISKCLVAISAFVYRMCTNLYYNMILNLHFKIISFCPPLWVVFLANLITWANI